MIRQALYFIDRIIDIIRISQNGEELHDIDISACMDDSKRF